MICMSASFLCTVHSFEIIIDLCNKNNSHMNFPHQLGNKFPPFPPPPPFMPWNINPFGSYPFLPPLPNPSLFGPTNSQNPIYIEQQNNYFASQRRNQYDNPFFEKLINPNDKSFKSKDHFPFSNSNKPIEIIEISDGETPKKKVKGKKREVSKQKRIRFQLKRLNNKKYTKALKKNQQYMEKEMKQFMEKVETQTKRVTRVSGRIPKEIKYDYDYQFFDLHQELMHRRQKQKEEQEQEQEQEQEHQKQQPIQKQQKQDLFPGVKFDTKFPHLTNTEQMQIWKKARKQQLLLRKISNQIS